MILVLVVLDTLRCMLSASSETTLQAYHLGLRRLAAVPRQSVCMYELFRSWLAQVELLIHRQHLSDCPLGQVILDDQDDSLR